MIKHYKTYNSYEYLFLGGCSRKRALHELFEAKSIYCDDMLKFAGRLSGGILPYFTISLTTFGLELDGESCNLYL